MAVGPKQRYKIEIGASSLWSKIDFDMNLATEWCNENCVSWWNADYHWKTSENNYIWVFAFEDESEKVQFILRWM